MLELTSSFVCLDWMLLWMVCIVWIGRNVTGVLFLHRVLVCVASDLRILMHLWCKLKRKLTEKNLCISFRGTLLAETSLTFEQVFDVVFVVCYTHKKGSTFRTALLSFST